MKITRSQCYDKFLLSVTPNLDILVPTNKPNNTNDWIGYVHHSQVMHSSIPGRCKYCLSFCNNILVYHKIFIKLTNSIDID